MVSAADSGVGQARSAAISSCWPSLRAADQRLKRQRVSARVSRTGAAEHPLVNANGAFNAVVAEGLARPAGH